MITRLGMGKVVDLKIVVAAKLTNSNVRVERAGVIEIKRKTFEQMAHQTETIRVNPTGRQTYNHVTFLMSVYYDNGPIEE